MDMTTPLIVQSERQCMRVIETLARLGDRWTLPVVVTLSEETMRFNQIRRAIEGISQQMLTRTLRTLERDGMISRVVHPTTPPQVEYALTPLGLALAEQAMRLGQWALAHESEIDEHRARFDRQRNA